MWRANLAAVRSTKTEIAAATPAIDAIPKQCMSGITAAAMRHDVFRATNQNVPQVVATMTAVAAARFSRVAHAMATPIKAYEMPMGSSNHGFNTRNPYLRMEWRSMAYAAYARAATTATIDAIIVTIITILCICVGIS